MRLLGSTLILLAFALPSFAGGTQGATPFNFLFLDNHPRPASLGGAYVALSGDSTILSYNPAGLSRLTGNDIQFMHNEHFEGISQEVLSLGMDKVNMAFSVHTLGFGKIQRTTLSNPSGSGLDTFTIRDWAVSAGHAQSFKGGAISLGLAGKYIQERIDTFQAQSAALDLGLLWRLMPNHDIPAAFGIAVQNLGPKVKFQSNQEDLPVNFRAGLAYQVKRKLLILADLNQPKNGDSTVHIGTEYRAFELLALRAGYNGRNDADSGVTLGFGLDHRLHSGRSLHMDYAFTPFGDLGSSHRISLGYRW